MSEYSIKNKRIARNTIVLYIRLILTIIVGLYSSRVILDALGVNDFGLYNLVGGFVMMFSAVHAGLISASQRFINVALGKDNPEELKHVFSTILGIYIFLTIFAVILVESVGLYFLENHLNIPSSRLYAAKWTFQFSVFSLICTLIGALANAEIVAHEKMQIFAFVSIFDSIAKLIIAVSIYFSHFDKLIFYSALMALESIIIQLINWSYCIIRFKECRVEWSLDWILIKEIYSFSLWSMLGGLAFLGFTQGVNVILGMFFAPAIVAARGIAMQVQGVIKNFADNFQTAVYPQIIKSYSKGEIDYFKKLLLVSSKYSFILLLFISLPFLLETDAILDLWLVEVPNDSSVFLRLVLLSVLFNAMTIPYEKAIHAVGKVKYYSLTTSLTFLSIVPVSYIVLKMGMKPYSVFIVQLVLTLIAVSIRMYMAKKIVNINLRDFIYFCIIPILKVSISSLIVPCLFLFFLPKSTSRFIWVSCFCIVSVIVVTYFFGMTTYEQETIKKAILNKFHKVKQHYK